MKILCTICSVFILVLTFAGSASAHFGMVIPSKPTVMAAQDANVELALKFWHPFANSGMNLVKPNSFVVLHDGKSTDLLPGLTEKKEQNVSTWKADYKITKPGLYVFAMTPEPYFEPEEDIFIVHYTKVYVDAFGDDEGWDKPAGLKAEIVPMSRPGALYAGNIFQGQVLMNGKPVAGAEVEVEWYPGENFKGVAPYESMVTQTVKADGDGVFSYVAPKKGWWGFAALLEGDKSISQDGEEKDVEIGAVMWVYFHDMLPAAKLK